jgi:DNA ligase 1
MPPKQVTLGYVKDSQTNITCVSLRTCQVNQFINADSWSRKFFGNPNGPKPPAKQSKLSFSSKSTSNGAPGSSASKENEDVDMAGAGEPEATSKLQGHAIAKKENVKPGTGRSRYGELNSIC